ncbi:MAG: hypothetical protein ISP24_05115, partial [Rickettsiales bacterium]|nr:hypothetical protein [Rickettsiales bacterium]
MEGINKREEKIAQYLKDKLSYENDKEYPLEIMVINNAIGSFEEYCDNKKEIDYMRFIVDLKKVYDASVKGFEDEKIKLRLSFKQLVDAITDLSDLDKAKNLGSIILGSNQQFQRPNVLSGTIYSKAQPLHVKPAKDQPAKAQPAKDPSGQDQPAKAQPAKDPSGQDQPAKAQPA